MGQRKPSSRLAWWPPRMRTVATSTVANEASAVEGVDILLMADDDPWLAANDVAESELAAAAGVDILLSEHDPIYANASSRRSAPKKAPGVIKRLILPRQSEQERAQRPFWWRWIYTLIFMLGMILIWIPVLGYVALAAPVYNSSWTIIIPGTQVGASIDLENLGEAFTDIKTPYGGNSFSPGVNYKAIMSSVSVMSAAADMMDLSLDDFGKPKIRVMDQAATLEVIFSGDSPELAQTKSQVLYDAFHNELERLRKNEVDARSEGSFDQIDQYRQQNREAQVALATYRDTSSVVSPDQYRSLVNSASKLEESLLEARVAHDAVTSRLESMADTLGVDAYRAADVMLLRQDKMVQVQAAEYARLQALYIEQASVLGVKHPKVIHAKAKADGSRRSMINRIKRVVGHADEGLLAGYLPDSESGDAQLYKEVVTYEAEREALSREITSLEALLGEMRGRIALAGSDLDELEQLERNYQMTTTILVSATSNLDLGRSNIYATYPLTQLLVAPTLPDRPKRLLKLLALLAGIIGSGLVILSLLIIKYRDRWRRLILKSA